MASTAVKERLAQDVGLWVSDGLIDAPTADLLRERWDQPGLGLVQIIRYFGYAGAFFAISGLLGAVAAMSRSAGFGAFELAVVGGLLLWWGVRLSQDPKGRYVQSCKVVLTMGFVTFALAAGVAAAAAGAEIEKSIFVSGLVALPVAFALAYKFDNTFLLVLGLIGLYHWIGAWTSMMGRSTYALAVEDPPVMALAAAAGAAFGAAHAKLFPKTPHSFAHAWEAVGLTYLNLSLLILGVGFKEHDPLAWILVWFVAGIAQILLGARLHEGVFTGFGVTAVAINLFTRYFERFWDKLDAGLFFLLGGAALFGAGFAIEYWARSRGLAAFAGGEK